MGYEYVTIDNQQVEKHVAEAFEELAAAFKRQFGLTLHVRSGMRTTAEQNRLYKLFLAGRGNQAAKPGTSDHEDGGPNGPRALDIYDSGKDYGVTRVGTVRHNWLKRNLGKFKFSWTGGTFKQVEAWHIRFDGALTDKPAASTPVNTSAVESEHDILVKRYGNPFGIADCRGLQKISALYVREPANKTKIDNDWGPKSQAGFSDFLRSKWDYAGDDVFGNNQRAATARWLRARWGYKDSDDVIGPNYRAALIRANTANFKEL